MNDDEFSLDAARLAADRGELGSWVERFLASDGSDNAVLGEQLRDEKASWIGPIEIRFDALHRLAGPPDQPTLERLTDDDLERVEDMAESVDDGWTPSPLVATFADDHLVLEDGNHRVEGLRRSGLDRYWTIIGFDDDDRRREFEASLLDEVTDDPDE